MTTCIVCGQRSAQRDDKFCTDVCYFMTVEGAEEVKARHVLKEAQAAARTLVLADTYNTVVNIPSAGKDELDAYAADDDGVDR